MNILSEKVCKACCLLQPINNFSKHSTTKDGFRAKCKQCLKAECHEYRKNNPEKMKELYKRAYVKRRRTEKYLSKKKERAKKYSATERGKLAAKQRAKRWRENGGKRKPQKRVNRKKYNWRLNNPERAAELDAFRRSAKKNATPPWLSEEDRMQILELYYVCRMFKIYTGQDYHVDHIVPLQNKMVCGLHIPSNLRVISSFDNHSKHNKFNEELGIDYTAPGYL
jgi:hypothetical protein